MGLLNTIKRVVVEDFDSKDRETIGKLAYIINFFMENVVRQFNGNIDFDNLNQDLTTFKITVDASGIPIGNNLIKTTVNNASGAIVINATNNTNIGTFPSSAPAVITTASGNLLKIKKVYGLQANSEYNLTILVLPRP